MLPISSANTPSIESLAIPPTPAAGPAAEVSAADAASAAARLAPLPAASTASVVDLSPPAQFLSNVSQARQQLNQLQAAVANGAAPSDAAEQASRLNDVAQNVVTAFNLLPAVDFNQGQPQGASLRNNLVQNLTQQNGANGATQGNSTAQDLARIGITLQAPLLSDAAGGLSLDSEALRVAANRAPQATAATLQQAIATFDEVANQFARQLSAAGTGAAAALASAQQPALTAQDIAANARLDAARLELDLQAQNPRPETGADRLSAQRAAQDQLATTQDNTAPGPLSANPALSPSAPAVPQAPQTAPTSARQQATPATPAPAGTVQTGIPQAAAQQAGAAQDRAAAPAATQASTVASTQAANIAAAAARNAASDLNTANAARAQAALQTAAAQNAAAAAAGNRQSADTTQNTAGNIAAANAAAAAAQAQARAAQAAADNLAAENTAAANAAAQARTARPTASGQQAADAATAIAAQQATAAQATAADLAAANAAAAAAAQQARAAEAAAASAAAQQSLAVQQAVNQANVVQPPAGPADPLRANPALAGAIAAYNISDTARAADGRGAQASNAVSPVQRVNAVGAVDTGHTTPT